MRTEREILSQEQEMSPFDLGKSFIERWYVPGVLSEETLNPAFLANTGKTLRYIARGFPLGFGLSMLDLGDLQGDKFNDWQGGNLELFRILWKRIGNTLNTGAFFFGKGTVVPISENDLLVTTPIAQRNDSAKEATDAIDYYHKTGKLDYYWRRYCFPPRNLKVGSKLFYVDNRAITGFAVVTDIVMKDMLQAHMSVDTWRWINPIPCDYGKIKPPQSYARAMEHKYFEGIDKVKVIGEWLDPMPQK
jgi:hypothetical protein